MISFNSPFIVDSERFDLIVLGQSSLTYPVASREPFSDTLETRCAAATI